MSQFGVRSRRSLGVTVPAPRLQSDFAQSETHLPGSAHQTGSTLCSLHSHEPAGMAVPRSGLQHRAFRDKGANSVTLGFPASASPCWCHTVSACACRCVGPTGSPHVMPQGWKSKAAPKSATGMSSEEASGEGTGSGGPWWVGRNLQGSCCPRLCQPLLVSEQPPALHLQLERRVR